MVRQCDDIACGRHLLLALAIVPTVILTLAAPASGRFVISNDVTMAPSSPCAIGLNAIWGQAHTTSGGKLINIASTLPPVFNPKVVPRSYTKLNSA